MVMIDTVSLQIERPGTIMRPVVDPEGVLRTAGVTVTVAFDVFLNPREIEENFSYEGRIEVFGGSGDRFRKLFDLTWIELLSVSIKGRPLVFQIVRSSFRVDPSRGETQSLRFQSQVVSSDLNEDRSIEIRFTDVPPPGFPDPGAIPNPDNPIPPPLGLPSFPRRDQAIDQITARVVLESTSFAGATSRDSQPVFDTF